MCLDVMKGWRWIWDKFINNQPEKEKIIDSRENKSCKEK